MGKHTLVKLFSQFRLSLDDPLRRLQLAVLLLVLLNLFGSLMYMLLERWEFVDSLYMTVITIATVGFGEVRELSPAGRVFTILLIYMGVGVATTAVSSAVSLAMGPVLWGSLRERRMRKMIDQIKDHYLVCGYGRMGQQIVRDLQVRDEPFVLVEANEERRDELDEENIPYILGDATEDDVLLAAGLLRAKGVVCALSSDAGNLMTVLTVRELNPRAFIVARVVKPESESKLLRAGANRVINPYQIGGHRLALSLLRPAVHDFLEQIFHLGEGRDVDIGQLHVAPDSPLVGKTIAASDLRDRYNVSVLAIQKPHENLTITPNPHTVIEANSALIIIGPGENVYQLERNNLWKW